MAGARWLLLAFVWAAMFALAACGGDSNKTLDSAGKLASSSGGTVGGPEPTLQGPASQFTLLSDDVGADNKVYAPGVQSLDASDFVATAKIFTSSSEGEGLVKGWGYVEGFETAFQPGGQLAAVLSGAYYVNAETYLFKTLDGARQAYQQFEKAYAAAPGSAQQTTKGLGNQSSAWKLVNGTVGSSDVVAAYHRFVFRRGTLVGVVQTMGADPYMTIDRARDLAVIMDDRALSKRAAPTPTPIPQPTLLPTVAAPSPSGR